MNLTRIKLFLRFLIPGLALIFLTGCKSTPAADVQAGLIAPRLIDPIEFDGFTVSQIGSPDAARRLMNLRLKSTNTVMW